MLAGQKDRQVFVRIGAPWCGWCHRLDAILAQPEVKPCLERDIVRLKIDLQRMTGGEEVAYSREMLMKGRRHMTEEDVSQLIETLGGFSKAWR